MAFRGLLRKAHVTASDQAIRVSDISFYGWGMLLRLSKTKTIQYGERTLEIPFVYAPGLVFCVATYTKRLIGCLQLSGRDLLFQYRTDFGVRPQSYHVFSDRLRSLCVDLNIHGVSSHSLRRGGASYLFSIGFTLVEIKSRGDWKSLAVLLYLTETLDRRISKDKTVTEFLSVA